MAGIENHPNYRWVIVACGALMTCVAIGAMFSLAIFLKPISEATGWSRAGISSGMTLNFIVMGAAGFAWGALSDRYGPRTVVLIGSALLGLAFVLASRATSLPMFQLTYGILVGVAAGSFFTPMTVATTGWFTANRGLAVSLVSAGIGVAPMTVSPFAAWLLTACDWRTSMLVIGVASWFLLLPAVLLVRAPPAAADEQGGAGADTAGPSSASRAFRSPQFIVLATTFFLCCAAHSGPIFHMVSYAMTCGIASMAAVSIYSVEGLAGLGGRVLFGVAADRLGVKLVLVSGLVIQAVAIAAYLYVTELGQFYVMATIFGATYGGVMPLYAVLAREYFGQRVLGAVFGAATMASSFGMALGPLGGGWVFDTFNVYDWMFIGSAMLGLGAVAIALAFPPFPKPAAEPARAA